MSWMENDRYKLEDGLRRIWPKLAQDDRDNVLKVMNQRVYLGQEGEGISAGFRRDVQAFHRPLDLRSPAASFPFQGHL